MSLHQLASTELRHSNLVELKLIKTEISKQNPRKITTNPIPRHILQVEHPNNQNGCQYIS